MGGEENVYALVCILPRTSIQVECVFVVVLTLTACGY